MTTGTRRWWWLLLFGGGAVVILGLGWEPITAGIREGWALLISGDPERIRSRLLELGVWAPMASALLQILSSLIPLLPGFVLAIANAMLYGVLLGGLLTFSTSLLAAAICFGVARVAGRSLVERLIAPPALERVNRFIEGKGWWAVFWGRLLPFINPDVVSYAAGLTRMGWLRFLVAMAAGALPATVVYSLMGAYAWKVVPGALILVMMATLLPLLLLWVFRGRIFRRRHDGDEEGPR